MTKEQIDQKYEEQHSKLEAEYFRIKNEGLPTQHRVLKKGKTMEDFNLAHAQLWKNHEVELAAAGVASAPLEE